MTSPFVRDRFTWLGYLTLAFYAYLQALIGPLMPFLREALNLNYRTAALHFSTFALGMILAGAIGDRVAARWGRWRVFWGGVLLMVLGGFLLALGTHPLLTIGGTTMMGVFGSFTLVMIQSTLSDHHGDLRAIALTEANVIAGVGAGITPLIVGFAQRSGAGWQFAPLVGCAYGLMLFLLFRRITMPIMREEATPSPGATHGTTLPVIFWAYWLAIFLSVSIEWGIIAWGADFLETEVGLRKVDASTMMSAFFVAFVLGRWGGSWLTRTQSPRRLLMASFAVLLLGFLPFWLAPLPALNIAGLFLAGLGVSNLFPMALSVASGVVTARQSDTASGRIALGAGMAVLSAPLILGTLADAAGISAAFGVVPVLIVLALLAILWANRLLAERERTLRGDLLVEG